MAYLKQVSSRPLLHCSKNILKPCIKLLYKLCRMGFGGNSLRWISEFLCGRTQYVRVQNEASSSQNVVSGIPQGTVLGPLMFLLYVNDMGDVLKHSDLVLYADDSKIFKSVVNDNDFNDMTSDISNFEKWVSDWQLKVNSEKC